MIREHQPAGRSPTTREVIDRFTEALNRHDADALAALLTEDTVFEDTSPPPDGKRVSGKEEVVAFDPPTRLVYRLASGLPVRDYRSVMTLEDDGDVTVLSWSSTFTPRIPLTGGLFRRIMSRAVDRFAAGIKAEAESRAGGTER